MEYETWEHPALSEAGVDLNDVREIVHYWSRADIEGWDGDEVKYVITLTDGRWVFVEGWCDYTGWGCQDGADAYYASSEEELVKHHLSVGDRELFGYPALEV